MARAALLRADGQWPVANGQSQLVSRDQRSRKIHADLSAMSSLLALLGFLTALTVATGTRSRIVFLYLK